jgi:hypothetical protein
MSFVNLTGINPTSVRVPKIGKYNLFFDLDGNPKYIDSDGNIYGFGGGSSSTQDLQGVTQEGNTTNRSMIIRNDSEERFFAVARGSKDIGIYPDKISYTSNGESSTQLNFENTLTPASILVRNLSGTIALLSDLTAIQEGISWKQPAELLLTSSDLVQYNGLIPRIDSLTKQGHTLAIGSRVVVNGSLDPAGNGIHFISNFAGSFYNLSRVLDANTTAELNNAVVSITNGTFAGKTFRQSTVNPVIGTDDVVFTEFGNSTVPNATNIIAGILKIYDSLGSQTDGGITPNAVSLALESFVPYSGATGNVDLGENILSTKSVHIKGSGGDGFLSLRHQDGDSAPISDTTCLFARSDGELYFVFSGSPILQIASRTFVQDQVANLKQNTVATTGTVISFETEKVYALPSAPANTNVTNNLTGAKIGVVQKIYHNNSTAPTFPAGWVCIGGTYTTSVLNIIYAEWVEASRVEYWIIKG